MQVLSIPKKKRVYAIAFAPDGRELAAACGDGTARVWDTATGELRHTLPVEETSCGYDLLYLDDHTLAVAGVGLFAWDLRTGGRGAPVPGTPVGGRLARSPDGRLLAVTDQTQSTDWPGAGLAVYDPADWLRLPVPADAANPSGGVAFSPDGRLLASSHIVRVGEKQRSVGAGWGSFPVNDYDYVVHVRELPSCRVVRTVPGWQQGARNLAFSPDGSVLAGTAGPRLRAWDLAADRELACHKRGTKHFQGLAFTADGRFAATVSNDETVRLWDARTWAEAATFTWAAGRLLNIALAPDGLRAAAGGDKGQVVIWDIE